MATHLTSIIYGGIFFLICVDIIFIVASKFLQQERKREELHRQQEINRQNYWMTEINKDPELTYTNPRVTMYEQALDENLRPNYNHDSVFK